MSNTNAVALDLKILVVLNPNYGFIKDEHNFRKFVGFDLELASFYVCKSQDEINLVKNMDINAKTIGFTSEEVNEFPFNVQLLEASTGKPCEL